MHGHLEIVKHLHSIESNVIQAVSTAGMNAFHLACSNGHIIVVKYLFSISPSPWRKATTDTFCTESRYSEVIVQTRWSGLFFAILRGDVEMVKYLNSKGCNHLMGDSSTRAMNPLHLACLHGKSKVAQYLITENKFDVNDATYEGWTALHFASRNGHLNEVQYLIEKGKAKTDATTESGLTVLHLASRFGHLDIVKYLVRHHCCDVDAVSKDDYRLSALHFAVLNGYTETVRWLVLHGKADLEKSVTNTCNSSSYGSERQSNWTPLQLAGKYSNLAMVQVLIELGADASGDTWGENKLFQVRDQYSRHYGTSCSQYDDVYLLRQAMKDKEISSAFRDGLKSFSYSSEFYA
jgi:serine/threonine-protein phosphatase 6 regulatory ankyrin repeat subunit B